MNEETCVKEFGGKRRGDWPLAVNVLDDTEISSQPLNNNRKWVQPMTIQWHFERADHTGPATIFYRSRTGTVFNSSLYAPRVKSNSGSVLCYNHDQNWRIQQSVLWFCEYRDFQGEMWQGNGEQRAGRIYKLHNWALISEDVKNFRRKTIY